MLDYYLNFEHRARGLLVTPFCMQDFMYTSIEDILVPLQFTTTTPTFVCDLNEFERMLVYTQGEGKYELKNLRRLLEVNGVNVKDRVFVYEQVVVQIVNRLSGIPIDVDREHCPWASSDYNVAAGVNIFETWPADNQPNNHRPLKACYSCSCRRKGCNYRKAPDDECGACGSNPCTYTPDKGECFACHSRGVKCVMGPCEQRERCEVAFKLAKSDMHVLTPLHQFVLATCSVAAKKKGAFPSKRLADLGAFLDEHCPIYRNKYLEDKIFIYSSAFQRVAILDGKMVVDFQRDHYSQDKSKIGEWWGFEQPDENTPPYACIAPHLGFPHPHDALVFMDHILGSPGDVFYRDMCILNKRFEPVSARIMGIAGVEIAGEGLVIGGRRVDRGSRVLYISLGWNKPYEQQGK